MRSQFSCIPRIDTPPTSLITWGHLHPLETYHMVFNGTHTTLGQRWRKFPVVSVGSISTQCLELSLDHSKCTSQMSEYLRLCHPWFGVQNQGLHGVTNWISLWDNLFVVKQTVSRILRNDVLVVYMITTFIKCYCTVRYVSRLLKLLFCAFNHYAQDGRSVSCLLVTNRT